MTIKTLIGAAAFAVAAGAANAGTVNINITEYAPNDIAGANAGLDAFMAGAIILGYEDFSGLVGQDNPMTTSVGNFTGAGATYPSGLTAFDCGGGDGATTCVRDGNEVGVPTGFRYSTSVGDDAWLDSNDMEKVIWDIPGASGLSSFRKIAFLLTDVDDVRNVLFEVTAAGSGFASNTAFNDQSGGEENGSIHLVTMYFDAFVSDLQIMMKVGAGDGLGIDNVTVGVVPLPAAGWLLLGGIGGLAALKRRKKA